MSIAKMFPDDGDRLMSVDEAAARLKTSPSVVRRLLEKRVIIPICNGPRRYIRKYALNDFLIRLEGQDILDFAGEGGLAKNGRCAKA